MSISCKYCLYPYHVTRARVYLHSLCCQLHLVPYVLIVVSVIPVFKNVVTGLDRIQVYTSCYSILNVRIVLFLFYSASVIIPVGSDAIYVGPESPTMLFGS